MACSGTALALTSLSDHTLPEDLLEKMTNALFLLGKNKSILLSV
jgi:hypothetical protein